MSYFLRSNKERTAFWLSKNNGDDIAAALAEGQTDSYWLIKAGKSGNLMLKSVTQGNPKTSNVMKVTVQATADGKPIGSVSVTE